MDKIIYKQGDATQPISEGNKIIVHICNDIGGWGKGFVVAISKRWSLPEKAFREWYKSQNNFELGQVQFVQVEDDLWVANVIGQHKIRRGKNSIPPIRYEAVKQGLITVCSMAKDVEASIHMPRIGCGLAGGKWEVIEPIIIEKLVNEGIKTVVYDFK